MSRSSAVPPYRPASALRRIAQRARPGAALLAAGLLAAGLLAGCSTAPQTYAERERLMPPTDEVITRNDWYRPWQTVGGATRAWPLDRDRIPPGALADALASAHRYETHALVVIQDGRLVFEDYASSYSATSRFNTQSMHRGLLALALFAALADGRIGSLESRVGEYLPAWRADPRGAITIAQLLYGRSGLASANSPQAPPGSGLQMFIGNDIESTVLSIPALAAPGGAFRPNEVEAQLAGLVLEAATGEDYARYLSRRLWRPLGASAAAVQLDRPGGHARMFCCLLASARDWARVGQLVLDQGRVGTREVLPRTWIERLREARPDAPASGPYWFLEATPLGPRAPGEAPPPVTAFSRGDVLFAGGRGGQRLYVIPSLRAVVVRIGRIRNDFDDGAFLNPFIAALATAPHPGPTRSLPWPRPVDDTQREPTPTAPEARPSR